MIGNAAEWVADRYHRDLRGAPRDGRPWNQLTGGPDELQRTVRGGSFDTLPQRVRVSMRDGRESDDFDKTVGFRCAADAD
jgi:formylglycine-generating enzyme required for sulfatase activity